MADDIVYVINDLGPPASYTAAHKIDPGECVEFHTPVGGCSVLFSHKVHHTCPKHIPHDERGNAMVLYYLAGKSDFSFYFSEAVTLEYWVYGPDQKEAPTLLSGSGHTVVVGGVGFEGG